MEDYMNWIETVSTLNPVSVLVLHQKSILSLAFLNLNEFLLNGEQKDLKEPPVIDSAGNWRFRETNKMLHLSFVYFEGQRLNLNPNLIAITGMILKVELKIVWEPPQSLRLHSASSFINMHYDKQRNRKHYFHLFKRQRDRQNEIFHLTVHFLKCWQHSGQLQAESRSPES